MTSTNPIVANALARVARNSLADDFVQLCMSVSVQKDMKAQKKAQEMYSRHAQEIERGIEVQGLNRPWLMKMAGVKAPKPKDLGNSGKIVDVPGWGNVEASDTQKIKRIFATFKKDIASAKNLLVDGAQTLPDGYENAFAELGDNGMATLAKNVTAARRAIRAAINGLR